jgi:hypothetical protein
MTGLLDFLSDHRGGILMLLLCLLSLVLFIQWMAWIFSKGRFGTTRVRPQQQNLRFVFSEAAVKLINDFRHLLALVIVLIFALALGYAMIQGRESIATMKEALQSVVATLGGLVGSIIGYYFGESTVTKGQGTQPSDVSSRGKPPEAVQGPNAAITEAPPPPDQPDTQP